MGARRLRSQEGNTNGDIPNQEQNLNPLIRQGSLYSLTFDEVQNQLGYLGKPLSSMNLDELLKSVWTAETNNQVQASSPETLNPNSNLMLSGVLSKKTVDEVWQDIQDGQKRSNIERKSTLGEITLEDFLVKAGIVAESSTGGGERNVGLSQESPWMNYQIAPLQSQQQIFMGVHQPISLGAHAEPQLSISSSSLMSSISDSQTPGRKRVASVDIAEKSVERRQKRMIKNRESAARSRARKQAYTQDLENKVSLLEEENERLKRQKELEKVLARIALPEPRYQLRRTSSAPM